MQKKLLLFSFLFPAFFITLAQPPQIPRGYFRNPMGIPMELTANFGELRTHHWHMGLDIRTNAKENLPVYAAAGGYIAAVGVRPLSFGRFIIVNHPNGLSTLYAHLNDFAPELEAYVTNQQYQQESWAIELKFSANQFPVSKGTHIGYSGNTGGSAGPHLHFEIMDTQTERRLNPLLFGFPLEDKVPPVIKGLAVYDRGRSINGQSPKIVPIKKTATGYTLANAGTLITSLNQIGLAIQAIDQVSGSSNPNGIYAATLEVDGQTMLSFILDSLNYEQTGYINAHIDYGHKKAGGAFYQHLSMLPGEGGVAYHPYQSNGVIRLTDTLPHQVAIIVTDPYQNKSVLQFLLKTTNPWLGPAANPAKLPGKEPTHFVPGNPVLIRKPDFQIDFPAMGLYDSLPIYYRRDLFPILPGAITARYQLNDPNTPVHLNFTVRLKPEREIPQSLRNKVVVQRTYGAIKKVKKANFENQWATAEFDDFGYFQAFVDTIPPQITLAGKGDTIDVSAASRLIFTPTDNLSPINYFRAELNDSWIRFTNDKGRNWIYRFDERCPYGVHKLKVTVEDLVGNSTTKVWWIKRGPYKPPVKKSSQRKFGKKKKQ
ncbi:MAG: M23 family metallopeptidase [Bacteroidetes bacterium]|nr:M23 family metallopeptidase [Bacteroidota bacterium]